MFCTRQSYRNKLEKLTKGIANGQTDLECMQRNFGSSDPEGPRPLNFEVYGISGGCYMLCVQREIL